MKLDSDLQAIQEVRNCLQEARAAQKLLETMSQPQIDAIVAAMAHAAEQEAERLGALAVQETGFGKAADKKAKNLFVAKEVYSAMKDMQTVGIIRKDEARQVWDIAQPVGTIAAIIPSTNPTSTVLFKCMIALKARNAIVISPHPSALRCSQESAAVMRAAAESAGAPPGLIHCLSQPTLEASGELMRHKLTDLILATGGTAMVKAAYSSGKPAYGVGPGNVPVYIHRSAQIERAVRLILQSKTFDYGTICASEQALVVDESVKPALIEQLQRQGAYFLNVQEKANVAAILTVGKGMNPRIVGRSPQVIAAEAGITIPEETQVLIAEESHVGPEHPFSMEKLSPVLALYTVSGWQEGCQRCIELLTLGGLGHTLGIHAEEASVIEAFGLEKPASRIVVNTGTTFGGIGATTGIFPSMTLGCGTAGNNITSDNIGPQHLLNIKRVAFGIKEMPVAEPVRETPIPRPGSGSGSDAEPFARQMAESLASAHPLGITREEVAQIVRNVLAEMQRK
ncbi:acetaldehyde dehydrogenase (acetylating) [Paenibacillus sp. GCM10023248]|uniref:acetaldehyde dehydrogenase (acetylating) n=1 Tax=Bacillales TaxID=1385 RepID=UPI002379B4EA|nr:MULTISPECIES: acetaldehyde dehydrogenase (acetylating) [Bacillales]MDD9271540.1 acetaldehyde dehydrogenase (acetylating) [Paenibacillus sp. MAHUQ-63]MDR6884277.1 acetaldehyde dehydrogenase (acetylating) [Bacillus sp. 3255]